MGSTGCVSLLDASGPATVVVSVVEMVWVLVVSMVSAAAVGCGTVVVVMSGSGCVEDAVVSAAVGSAVSLTMVSVKAVVGSAKGVVVLGTSVVVVAREVVVSEVVVSEVGVSKEEVPSPEIGDVFGSDERVLSNVVVVISTGIFVVVTRAGKLVAALSSGLLVVSACKAALRKNRAKDMMIPMALYVLRCMDSLPFA